MPFGYSTISRTPGFRLFQKGAPPQSDSSQKGAPWLAGCWQAACWCGLAVLLAEADSGAAGAEAKGQRSWLVRERQPEENIGLDDGQNKTRGDTVIGRETTFKLPEEVDGGLANSKINNEIS